MKILQLLFISIIFIGCDYNSPPVKEVDSRPIEQLSLIRKLNVTDSLYLMESNDIKKTEILEKGKAEVIKFIEDTLHSEVKKWPAVVKEITVITYPVNYIDVILHISKKLGKFEDASEFKIIILHAKVSQSDTIKNSLRELLKGDQVFVSGSFEKDVVGNVDFLGQNSDDRNTFSAPEFNFKIESISKAGKQ